MNKLDNFIDNSKLVLEMFEFKKGLSIEQDDIERIVNHHIGLFNCDDTGKIHSQRTIVKSLSEKLNNYAYDKSVKQLVENVNAAIAQDELFYELEDLYRQLESTNTGEIYRHPMQVVLNIINESTDRQKHIKILNELRIYDWIPQVKNFMFKFTTNPRERQNISSEGGKADVVYSVVEKVKTEKESGFLTFVGDKWFIITESTIEPTTPSNHINDKEKLMKLGLLEKALRMGAISGDEIVFEIEEGLDLGVSFKNGDITLNGQKQDKAATLESIFDSPIVSFMRRDMYPVIAECIKNLDKFTELDIVQRVTNITKPTLECFAFNYKNTMYVYNLDKRFGNSFYEYDSATMLVSEMRTQLGYDLSNFFENKFNEEVRKMKSLEDSEKMVFAKLSEINENIAKLEACGLMEVSEQIKAAHETLLVEKSEAASELETIKGLISNEKHIK
jgi:hypothetical protein